MEHFRFGVLLPLSIMMGLSLPARAAELEGPYIGVQLAVTRGSTDTDEIVDASKQLYDAGIDSDTDYTGGFYAGYGLNLGSIYVGAEVDYIFRDSKIRLNLGDKDTEIEQKSSYFITARLGIPMTDRGLLFLRAGYGAQDWDSNVPGQGDSVNGFLYGGGIEYKMIGNFALRAEILNISYDELTLTRDANQFRYESSDLHTMIALSLYL